MRSASEQTSEPPQGERERHADASGTAVFLATDATYSGGWGMAAALEDRRQEGNSLTACHGSRAQKKGSGQVV